jgi:hypothetical protein
MLQLVQEQKSLWRIKNSYMKDHDNCSDCKVFWEKMLADKESHTEELMQLIKAHTS